MSEIRDRALGKILKFIRHGYSPESIAKDILSIPELAIVDREAELPRDICQDVIDRIGATREDAGSYKRSQQDMLKVGWVREVKEEK